MIRQYYFVVYSFSFHLIHDIKFLIICLCFSGVAVISRVKKKWTGKVFLVDSELVLFSIFNICYKKLSISLIYVNID